MCRAPDRFEVNQVDMKTTFRYIPIDETVPNEEYEVIALVRGLKIVLL